MQQLAKIRLTRDVARSVCDSSASCLKWFQRYGVLKNVQLILAHPVHTYRQYFASAIYRCSLFMDTHVHLREKQFVNLHEFRNSSFSNSHYITAKL